MFGTTHLVRKKMVIKEIPAMPNTFSRSLRASRHNHCSLLPAFALNFGAQMHRQWLGRSNINIVPKVFHPHAHAQHA